MMQVRRDISAPTLPMLPTSRFGVAMSIATHRYLVRHLRLIVESEDALTTWTMQGRLEYGRLETLYAVMAAVPDIQERVCGGQRPKLSQRELGTLLAFAQHLLRQQEQEEEDGHQPSYPPSFPAMVKRLGRLLGNG